MTALTPTEITAKLQTLQAKAGPTYHYFKDEASEPIPYRKRRKPPSEQGPKVKFQHFDGTEWKDGLNGIEQVIYCWPELVEDVKAGRTIYFTEGEKDVDNLRSLGLAATTSGGTSSLEIVRRFAYLFEGATVVIIPDNDDGGRKFANDVARVLSTVADVSLLTLPDVPEKGDVSDYLIEHTLEELLSLEPKPWVEVVDTETTESVRDMAVDWAKLFGPDTQRREFLFEPILPVGTHVVLFSPPKAGKSLFALELALTLATGAERMGRPLSEPQRVFYLDFENSPSDLLERLEDMGLAENDPALALMQENLIYLQFPDVDPFDTAKGGEWLISAVDELNPALVIIDTAARAVAGDENSADTYRALYRHSITALKRRGVSLLVIDHAGKDAGKGVRGSSDKVGMADIVYSLTVSDSDVILNCKGTTRINWVAERVRYTQLLEPFRHVPETLPFTQAGIELARILDELDVPLDATRREIPKALKDAGLKPRRVATISEAQRIRRDRANKAGRNQARKSLGTTGTKPGTRFGNQNGNQREPSSEQAPISPSTRANTTGTKTGTNQIAQREPSVTRKGTRFPMPSLPSDDSDLDRLLDDPQPPPPKPAEKHCPHCDRELLRPDSIPVGICVLCDPKRNEPEPLCRHCERYLATLEAKQAGVCVHHSEVMP
ncbi:MAG: AAA family ATPase [Ferrimicrobium sp.]